MITQTHSLQLSDGFRVGFGFDNYKGEDHFYVRLFSKRGNKWVPTKIGIMMSPMQGEEFLEMCTRLLERRRAK